MSGETKGLTIFGVVAAIGLTIFCSVAARSCAEDSIARTELEKVQTRITCTGPGCTAIVNEK